MAVDVEERAEGLEMSLPTALFEVGRFAPWLDQYAVTADGQRFLVKVPIGEVDTRLHVILNWTSLLETNE